MSNFQDALKQILKREGGYANVKGDRGGETMYGVTIAVARANGYTGPMKELPMSVVETVYKTQYWDPLKLDAELSHAVAERLFDIAVNCGVSKAKAVYGRAVAAGADQDPNLLVRALTILQGEHYLNLATANITQRKFLKGWFNRLV